MISVSFKMIVDFASSSLTLCLKTISGSTKNINYVRKFRKKRSSNKQEQIRDEYVKYVLRQDFFFKLSHEKAIF